MLVHGLRRLRRWCLQGRVKVTTTVQSIVDDVRKLIDVAAQSHYEDGDIAQYVVEGVHRLYALRPSARYGACGIDNQVFPERAPSSASAADKEAADAVLLAFAVRINELRWRTGVIYFAASRCYEVGITDSVNLQLAQTLKKQADEIFMA